MKHNWLSTSSFERVQEVIAAINILSIHAKLNLAGLEDPTPTDDIQQAKQYLLAFLDRFQTLIQDVELDNSTIVGADPRLGELAVRYLAQKRCLSRQTPLYEVSIDQLKELITAEELGNIPLLVSCLRELRSLVDQHAYEDVVDLLGEI